MVSPGRLREVHGKLGLPPLDDLDDYLKRLDAETKSDNSLQDYLDWIQIQGTMGFFYQIPQDWLKKLCNVQFSDVLSVTDVRCALSFKEVDYLCLAADGRGDSMYLITSDPSALKLEPSASSNFSGSDQLSIHPALISLSVSAVDEPDSTYQRIPRLVLPVGRLLSEKPNKLLHDILDSTVRGILLGGGTDPNSLGIETLPTPIKYFEELLHDVPALIEYLKLSPPDMAALNDYFKLVLLHQLDHRRIDLITDVITDVTWRSALKEYTQKNFKILTGSVKIPQISSETLERKRRELWHDIMKTTTTFKEACYVAVIDAVIPNALWLVESPQQEDVDGRYKVASGTAHALPIVFEAKQWLDSYGRLSEVDEISWKMKEEYLTRYPLVVKTVGLAEAQAILSRGVSFYADYHIR